MHLEYKTLVCLCFLGGRRYRIIDPKTCTVKECKVVHLDESSVLQVSKQALSGYWFYFEVFQDSSNFKFKIPYDYYSFDFESASIIGVNTTVYRK